MDDQPCIVIFGAAVREDGTPSGALKDRVTAAAQFGRDINPPPIYIVTGAQGRYGPPEAEVMARLLVQHGIDPDNIILEPTGRNTLRSAIAVHRIIRNVKGPLYVATSSYHMPRCVLLLRLTGLRAHRGRIATGGPASSRWMRRWWWRLRELPAIPVDMAVMTWLKWRNEV